MGRSPGILLALILCTVVLRSGARAAPLPAEWPEHRMRLALGSQSSFPQALQHYQPFVHYLEREIGIPMDLVQVPEASDQLRRLDQGSVDLALVDGAFYWKYRSRLDVLGIQKIRGSLQRRALLAVRSGAAIRTATDLDGKPIASVDDWDTLGTLWVRSAAGPEAKPRFIRASSYVDALRDVILGRAEGAAVQEDVFRHFFSRYPRYRGSVRVIATSPLFSNLVLVVRRTLSAAARREFQGVVRGMGETLEGAAVLAAMGIGGFVAVEAGFFKQEEALLSRLALEVKGDLHGVPAAIFAK